MGEKIFRRGLLSMFAAVLILLSLLGTATTAQASGSRFRALLIGCSSYASLAPSLGNACINDVGELARVLRTSGYRFGQKQALASASDIVAIANTKAMPDNSAALPRGVKYKHLSYDELLGEYIPEAYAGATDNDVSLFYFSGHGLDGGSLLISDGKQDYYVSPETLKNELSKVRGKKLLIIDACYSGALIGKGIGAGSNDGFKAEFMKAFDGDAAKSATDSADASYEGSVTVNIDPAFATHGFEVMVASSGKALSYSERYTKNNKHPLSMFTKSLTQGLGSLGRVGADANVDGRVSINELFTWTRETTLESDAQMYPSTNSTVFMAYSKTAENKPAISGVEFAHTVNPGEVQTVRAKLLTSAVSEWSMWVYKAGSDRVLTTDSGSGSRDTLSYELPTRETGKYVIKLFTSDLTQPVVIKHFEVSAKAVKVTAVKASKEYVQLKPGASKKLTANVRPSAANYRKVVWSTSNSKVVSIDRSGNITGKSKGIATITATSFSGRKTARITVCVSDKPVSSIGLSSSRVTLGKGRSYKLCTKVRPTTARFMDVEFKSSNELVATVDAKGKIKAGRKGTAVITATTRDGGKQASCTVNVR